MRVAKIACLSIVALCPVYADDALLQWMDRIAQKQLTSRVAAIAKVRTKADAERRRKWIRSKLLDIIGGLPDYRGPLNARVLGRLTNPHYTLEKIIFESLPRYYVTADLYLPREPGRHAAVLMSAGHTTLGKTENHRIAANLASKGFIALAYDPVGLGERVQSYDRSTHKRIAGCCADEHLHAGAQSLLAGESVARYFIHDAVRAIDYLVSRPEVDAARIGAAGCSGGGCITTYVAALDPRIKAAAPACFLNSLRVLFSGPYPDSEMSLPRFLASGLDHADFLAVSNGIPWLILATEGDFFTPRGVQPVYEQARRWYSLFGEAEKVRMFMGPGKHGTPLETREALYAFFIEWLQPGSGVDPRESNVTLYSDRELQVTSAGQVEFEEGSRWLYEVIRERLHSRKQPLGLREFSSELRRLGIPAAGRPPAFTIVEQKRGRIRLHMVSEPGVTVAATLYLPTAVGRRPALLLVKDATTESLAEAATRHGSVVLEIEPRDSLAANDNRPFLGNWMTNSRANCIGRNLPAMRAHDIVRGVDLLQARKDVRGIRAVAREVKGVWLLLAAAADRRIASIWLDRTPHSLAASLDGPIHTRLFDATIPGFLLHWDLADMVRATGDRPVLWTDPADWMGRVAPGLGPAFRYRSAGETDETILAEFLN